MNLAILIDAENVLPAHADMIFSHAASLGDVVCKEIYGAAQALTSWVAPVLKYAMHANLTIRASKGKNSSDIALVIGAMDLLASRAADTVIIASSDSDFSALSVRLRGAGIEVIGMGTDKSNELWRTSCSSFVVLQQPGKAPAKPAAIAKAAPAPAPARAAAPEQKSRRAPRAAASTHEERAAVLRAFILRQLESHGGRIQTGMLFPMLNKLPEYIADKKGSGKKPLNYLTATFGDAFKFEDGADGNSWLSLSGAATESLPALDTVVEAPAGADAETAAPEAAPADAPAPMTIDLDAPDEPEGEAVDPLALLVEAGLPEDVARQIVVIFTESDGLRDAYNRLRKTFGATAGREYYQKVKDIAAQQR